MSDQMQPAAPVPADGSRPARRGVLASLGAVAAGGGLLALAGTQSAEATVYGAPYSSYGPERFVDSRSGSGGRLAGGSTRTLTAFAGLEDYTLAINLTVVNTKGSGFLALYNADLSSRPGPYSSINWQGSSKTVANFSMLDCGAAGVKIYCSGSSGTSTHFLIDVVGFYYLAPTARTTTPGFAQLERQAKRVDGSR